MGQKANGLPLDQLISQTSFCSSTEWTNIFIGIKTVNLEREKHSLHAYVTCMALITEEAFPPLRENEECLF